MQNTLVICLMFLFIYCFLGWVWESLYVSFRKREWVNRGFLHGPLLPIYGFGAIIILWMTFPYSDSLVRTYLLGSLGATILEYITGTVMLQLFNARYWDYSDHNYNLNGHISLLTSLGWGFFSILLVKVIHPTVENLVLNVPILHLELICLILMIVLIIDTTLSIQNTQNKKELVANESATSNKKSDKLQKEY